MVNVIHLPNIQFELKIQCTTSCKDIFSLEVTPTCGTKTCFFLNQTLFKENHCHAELGCPLNTFPLWLCVQLFGFQQSGPAS